jgi:hypothetical protein
LKTPVALAASPGRPGRWSVAGLVVLLSAIMATAGWRGSYYVDDFLNLGLAREAHLGRKYLEISVFGHLEPGFRLINYALARLPFDYHISLAITVACYAASLVFFYRILVCLFGSCWSNLLITLAFGASSLWLTTIFWSASGLEVLTAGAAILMAIDAYLRMCATGRWRYFVVMVVAFGVALGFYEKAVLLAVELPLLSLVLEVRRVRAREVLAVARRQAIPWLTLLIIAVAYSWFYLGHHYGGISLRPSLSQVGGAFSTFWLDGFVPGLLGGPLTWQDDHSFGHVVAVAYPPVAWVIIAQLVIVGAVVFSIVRRPQAWRSWVFFAVIAALSFGAVAIGRVGAYGVDIGRDSRYIVDITSVFWLAFAMALVPSRLGAPGNDLRRAAAGPQPPPWGPIPNARWVYLAAAAALLARVVIFAVSVVNPSDAWARNPWIPYAANVARSLPTAGSRATLYDDAVPDAVIQDFIFPYNRLSNVLGLAERGRVMIEDAGVPAFYVRKDGTIARAVYTPVLDLLPDGASALDVDGFVASAGGELCAQGPEASLSAGLAHVLPARTWFARVKYRAAGPFRLTLMQMDSDGNQLAIPWNLPGGDHVAMVPFTSRTVTRVAIVVSSKGEACVSAFAIGWPTDRP